MFLTLLAQANPPSAPGSGLLSLLPFLFLFVIFYYMMIRPQQKRAKEQTRLISSLKTGDHVITSSGIHGMISNVKDTTVIVKVADNVKIEMEKSAVTTVAKTEA
ncbi:MAG: preprotein translocase subunit YajC [Chthoniobacterales bacterium]